MTLWSSPASLEDRFREVFDNAVAAHIARAPGRVNLIGEHTDYNEGWALPMAIDRYVSVAFAPNPNSLLRAHATAFDETEVLELDQLGDPGDRGWISYIAGMAWALSEAGHEISGVDCLIDGDVPLASGLSSSAALEMATARAFCEVSGIPWSAAEMARLGQRAENDYLGVASGPMDQLTSAAAQPGCALLVDFRTLEVDPVPMPRGAKVVVLDTGVKRKLGESGYNARRASCEAAVEALQQIDPAVRSLRDATFEMLESARDGIDPIDVLRARHVIAESERPSLMATALRDGDFVEAGRLMNDSHESLRDLYEVSSPELDLITDIARHHSGCFGARMTGAGFGGCAVALVAAGAAGRFIAEVERAYGSRSDRPSTVFVCDPVGGAELVTASDVSAHLLS